MEIPLFFFWGATCSKTQSEIESTKSETQIKLLVKGKKIPLFVYGGGGLAGRYPEHYTDQQLKFVAQRFSAGLWIYGNTGVSEKLKEFNPDFETYLYYNFMYSGCYKTGMGQDWIPCEDWEYIRKHEDTMLAKNTSDRNPHPKKWIQNPIWKDEYLVNVLDVNPENPGGQITGVDFL